MGLYPGQRFFLLLLPCDLSIGFMITFALWFTMGKAS
jgi:hypothetical protein